jgi:hypothetical protein
MGFALSVEKSFVGQLGPLPPAQKSNMQFDWWKQKEFEASLETLTHRRR